MAVGATTPALSLSFCGRIMKFCKKCCETKRFSEFHNDKTKKDGKHSICKPCAISAAKRVYHNNKDAILVKRKERYWEDPNRAKDIRIKCMYGITLDEFNQLLNQQNHKCVICNDDITTSAVIDHNHTTKEVRGLLCPLCNSGIGKLKDSPDVLLSAYNYLVERGSYGRKAT